MLIVARSYLSGSGFQRSSDSFTAQRPPGSDLGQPGPGGGGGLGRPRPRKPLVTSRFERLDGRYEVGQELGHGQFGWVYAATALCSGNRVAVLAAHRACCAVLGPGGATFSNSVMLTPPGAAQVKAIDKSKQPPGLDPRKLPALLRNEIAVLRQVRSRTAVRAANMDCHPRQWP